MTLEAVGIASATGIKETVAMLRFAIEMPLKLIAVAHAIVGCHVAPLFSRHSGSACVFTTEVAFAFAQEIVLVTLATTPVEFLTGHALLIVTPTPEGTLTTTSILRLLAFIE